MSGDKGAGEAIDGTRTTAGDFVSPKGRTKPTALVIYASGKVVDRGDSRATGAYAEQNTPGPFDGADIGEDEDPLGDLEEMASGVEAGKL